MSAYDQQQEIIAELKKIKFGPDFINVYSGAVDDGTKWTVEEGESGKPFMTIQFAGFAQVPKRQKHLTGAKYNSKEMVFSVTCIANDDESTRQVWDRVCTTLTGFEPQNAGEIQEALFASLPKITYLGSPTKYSLIQSFTFNSNSFVTC